MAENPNTALYFNPDPAVGLDTVTAYNGREWTFDHTRKIWKLTDATVLVFEGGDAIDVDRNTAGSIETSLDMDKVDVAPNVTSSGA